MSRFDSLTDCKWLSLIVPQKGNSGDISARLFGGPAGPDSTRYWLQGGLWHMVFLPQDCLSPWNYTGPLMSYVIMKHR